MNRKAPAGIAAIFVIASLAACTESTSFADESATGESSHANSANHAQSATAASADARTNAALPLVTVHKSPTCGCCEIWVEHMRQAGFPVEVRDVDNLDPIKTAVGIPPGKGSCHTAKVGDYFVEGHVHADQVKRLLTQKPDAKGLTVPGMPLGSPGMEVASGKVTPYDVLLVAQDGSTSVFAHYGD